MQKHIEKYIPLAYQVIKAYEDANLKMEKELKGHLASIGAGILMSGLIPTLAVYASQESNSQTKRYIVLDWIWRVLECPEADRLMFGKAENYAKDGNYAKKAFEHALDLKNDKDKFKQYEQNILDASIALKLCIRTFELTK